MSGALTNQALHTRESGSNTNQSDPSARNRDPNVHMRRYTVDSSFQAREVQNSPGDHQSAADSQVLATLKTTGISFPTSNSTTTKE